MFIGQNLHIESLAVDNWERRQATSHNLLERQAVSTLLLLMLHEKVAVPVELLAQVGHLTLKIRDLHVQSPVLLSQRLDRRAILKPDAPSLCQLR